MKVGDLVKMFTPGGDILGLIVRVIPEVDPTMDLFAVKWSGQYSGQTSIVSENEIEIVKSLDK